MSRHAPLWCSLSIVAVLLLSACQSVRVVEVDGKSAADKQHELQVACLTGGRVWDGSKCGDLAPPTPAPPSTPIPTPSPAATATPTPSPAATATPTPSPAATATPTTIPTAKPLSPTEIITRSRAYVVRIDPATGCASGVMLGKDGLILTNHHVVDGQELLFATTDNGTIAPLRVLFSDPSADLALVQAMTTLPEPEPIVWGDDTKLDLGTQLFVLGYPLCSDSVTVTSGIYSVRTSFRGHPLLQTDAALNPGVSGGLAITPEGRPIGVAVAGITALENVGFLIPADVVKAQIERWLAEIEAGRFTSSPTPTATARPTATPTDRQDWVDAFGELYRLEEEDIAAHNALEDRVRESGKTPSAFLDEWEDQAEAYQDGAYDFVRQGKLPRFSEVREINDRIVDYVEANLRQQELHIEHLKTGDRELYDESQALRVKNNKEWKAINDMADDLYAKWFS